MIDRTSLPCLVLGLVLGCAPGMDAPDDEEAADTSDEALSSGVNGSACLASPYNCKLRAQGGNRVENAQDGLWGTEHDVILDGNGQPMGTSSWDHLRFNYGQTRRIGDRTYAFAMSTSVGSAGWFPLDAVKSESVLRDRIGEVNAHAAGLAKMACYAVRSSAGDPGRAALKVVYDTDSEHERVGDYLPLERKNGGHYMNLAFNVPGFGLGGVAVDIFPAGTRFRRLDVPTDSGRPSIDIPVWKKDGSGRYRAQAGSMKFVYGTVTAADGARRNGWMAYEGLEKAGGCAE